MTKRTRTILKIFLFVGLIILGNILAQWFIDRLDFELTPANELDVHRVLMGSMIVYIILMAIPFVPGMEIGLAVMMVFGPKIVLLVYVSTLAAFSLSFMIGRFIPERMLINFLRDIHLNRASELLAGMEGLDPQQRLQVMLQRSPKIFVPFLLKYRYLALVAAINLPGNVVIGGGGGIALMAGLSRLFSPPMFLLTTAIAISPLPLAWLFFGGYFIETSV